MHSAEVLSQLRSLNWLVREAQRLPAANAERLNLDAQIAAVRGRLPVSILAYHDDRTKRSLPSVANLNGSSCGNCHLELPADTIRELAAPGRFSVCPSCGIFIWSGDDLGTGTKSSGKGTAR